MPLAPPGLGPGPHLLPGATVSPRRAAPKGGSLPTTRGRTPRRFGSFFKRRSSLGRRRRGCRHRCYRCPTPPTEGTVRGRSAEVEGSLLFREHFGFFRKSPSSRRTRFGAPFRLRLLPKGAEEDWEALGMFGPFRRAKGWEKGNGKMEQCSHKRWGWKGG